jgi:hypothetical protein
VVSLKTALNPSYDEIQTQNPPIQKWTAGFAFATLPKKQKTLRSSLPSGANLILAIHVDN